MSSLNLMAQFSSLCISKNILTVLRNNLRIPVTSHCNYSGFFRGSPFSASGFSKTMATPQQLIASSQQRQTGILIPKGV